MRRLAGFVVLYPLFLLQVALAPWSPDLLLLTVIALALAVEREPSPDGGRLLAAGRGALAGVLVDLVVPGAFGANMVAYAVTGYATAVLAGITYRAPWAVLLAAAAGLGLRLLVGGTGGTGMPSPWPLAVSLGFTLLLALPWQWTVRHLLRT
ncbi:MAG: hypothetical protein R6X12_10230 [bacterium]